MGDVDLKIIKSTQLSLGKFVKKPQLTEKLLQKPPFRFLHDIIKAVISETGFLDGLFTVDELIYENIKDKDSKLAFLNKLIGVVKLTSGKSLGVKASKIVAGQEAQKTNELLQAVAYCIDQKLDGKEAIQLVLNNSKAVEKKPVKNTKDPKATVENGKETKPATTAAKKEVQKNGTQATKKIEPKNDKINKKETINKTVTTKTKKPDVKGKEEPKGKKIERQNTVTLKDSSLEKSLLMENSSLEAQKSTESGPVPSLEQENLSDNKNSLPGSEEKEITPLEPETKPLDVLQDIRKEPELKDTNTDPPPTVNENSRKNSLEKPEPLKDGLGKIEPTFVPIETPRRGSIPDPTLETLRRETMPHKRFAKVSSEEKITHLRPPSVRPPSARPGAPKRRDKSIEIASQPEPNIANARNVPKLDIFDNELDDNIDNLIVIEDPLINGSKLNSLQNGDEDLENAGHLVKQIIETQQKFNNITNDNGIAAGPWESLLESHRLSSAKTEDLRTSIQTLTKSINPLGNLLDFIQEDIDVMQIELNQQMTLYNNAIIDLDSEKRHTEAAIKPFRLQLQELQEDIKFHKAVIRDKHCSILMNEEKIAKVLKDL